MKGCVQVALATIVSGLIKKTLKNQPTIVKALNTMDLIIKSHSALQMVQMCWEWFQAKLVDSSTTLSEGV